MNPKIKLPNPSLIGKIFIIYYIVGIIGLSIATSRDLFTALMPFSLLLSMVVLLFYHSHWKPTHVYAMILIALLGFFVEVAGVLTGDVFGQYSYGRALGFKVFETPLMIGVNWIMLIYCVHTIMGTSNWPKLLRIPIGALVMVGYDLVMEPVAIRLDMWSWGGGIIPLQNYIAWFVISLVFLAILHFTRVRTNNKLAPWLFGVQACFFLVLNFTL
jgi:bisanhydrobacterioruberin hydratase